MHQQSEMTISMQHERSIRPDRIRRRLEVTGLSAWDASKRAGLSHDAIRDIQRGKTKQPRRSTVVALCEVLECDPGYLTGELDRPRSTAPRATSLSTGQFFLDDDDLAVLSLYRRAKDLDEGECVIEVIRTIIDTARKGAVDERGRKLSRGRS